MRLTTTCDRVKIEMALSVYVGSEPLGEFINSYRVGNMLYSTFSYLRRFVRYSWTGLKGKYDSNGVMKYAVKNNRELLFRLSHDTLQASASSALYLSAKYNRLKFMGIAISEWQAINYDEAMVAAAAAGNIDCMRLAQQMGSSAVNRAMAAAAAAGSIGCVTLCKEMGATDYNKAFVAAAVGGKLECLFLLRDYGATNLLEGYSQAHIARQIVCAQQCKSWAGDEAIACPVTVNVSKWTIVNDPNKKKV